MCDNYIKRIKWNVYRGVEEKMYLLRKKNSIYEHIYAYVVFFIILINNFA